MADTGAPWNLPYPLPTDLVRDGAQAIQDLAEAAAAGLDLAGNAGIGPNVANAVELAVFSSTSASFTTVGNLSVSITPSSDTAKVLVIAQISVRMVNNTGWGHFKVTRGGTDIYIGNAASNRIRAVFGGTHPANLEGDIFSHSIVCLDSPGTATSVTYQVEGRRSGPFAFAINSSQNDTDNDSHTRGASSITVIEVAA